MPFAPITWINKVTKLGPTNLNRIEQGIDDAHAGLIDDLAITTGKIADLAVTTGKIAANAVTAAKIAANTITAAEIAADAIGASELAANAVDTNAIVDDAVTAAKLAADAQPMVVIGDSGFLSGTQANFDFTNIPAIYNHLRVLLYVRGDTAAAQTGVAVRFNNDSGANYDHQYLAGTAGTPGSGETFGATSAFGQNMPANTAGANLFGSQVLEILFYQSANHKVFSVFGNMKIGVATTNLQVVVQSEFWRSTAVINRITLTPSAGNFQIGSRAILYGVN